MWPPIHAFQCERTQALTSDSRAGTNRWLHRYVQSHLPTPNVQLEYRVETNLNVALSQRARRSLNILCLHSAHRPLLNRAEDIAIGTVKPPVSTELISLNGASWTQEQTRMEQTQIAESEEKSSEEGPVHIYYREIQKKETQSRVVADPEAVSIFQTVLDGFDRQTRKHQLSDLDMDDNPSMLIEDLLTSYPDHGKMSYTMLMNDFCDSMRTRAREKGKYVVLILTEGSLHICHSDSNEKTITKEADVIERLLDTDNVDKYVRFSQTAGDELVVQQHERHNMTKSFSEWLGIDREEIAYRSAGEVNIFTEVDEATCAFQFTPDNFEQDFLLEDSAYELVDNTFKTSYDEYTVQQVQFGRKNFSDTDEFLQEFYTVYYDVYSYREQYSEVVGSMEPYTSQLFDHRKKVTVGTNGRKIVRKHHNDFDIIFAGKHIDLHAGRRVDLCQSFENGKEVRLYHAGAPFSKEHTRIGSLNIFNEIDLDDATKINRLYNLVTEAKTMSFSNVLCYIILTAVHSRTKSPVSHFIGQLAQKYADRLTSDGLVISDETDTLEFKSRDWFAENDDNELAEKLVGQIQGDVKLLIGGVEEDRAQFKPLDIARFNPERNASLQRKLESKDSTHESIEVNSIPLGEDDCLLYVLATHEDHPFSLNAALPA